MIESSGVAVAPERRRCVRGQKALTSPLMNPESGVLLTSTPRYMETAMKRVFVVSIVVLSGCTAACSSTNQKSVPPILRGATAHGGWWGACPPSSETEVETRRIMRELAVSPEFNSRLESGFPPGSSEQAFIDSLTGQGFVLSGRCKADSTVRIASFHADGSGFLAYATNAQVYWQADADGRIVWTKGFVRYTGL